MPFNLITPPLGLHFIVFFHPGFSDPVIYPGIPDISFQEVSGIDVTFGTEEYQEGGENRFKHKLLDIPTYSDLVLKRGMLIGSAGIQWFAEQLEKFRARPVDVIVILLNGSHLPLQAWNFINAWPKKWEFESLDAQNGKVFIEKMTLSYQYYKRLDPVAAAAELIL